MPLYVECNGLTDSEKQIRHELIYLFNSCLKFLFNQKPHFKEYAYNSCRQTAIFSAAYLMNVLPGSYAVYEGNFSDVLHGEKVDYVHAFVIRSYQSKKFLIDVSRTQRKLLFQPVDKIDYPNVEGYENIKLLSYNMLDFMELLSSTEREFLTEKRPMDVFCETLTLMNKLRAKTKHEQLVFAAKVYDETTEIGGEFL